MKLSVVAWTDGKEPRHPRGGRRATLLLGLHAGVVRRRRFTVEPAYGAIGVDETGAENRIRHRRSDRVAVVISTEWISVGVSTWQPSARR